MESSKATACHIKQVAGDPRAVQINLVRHQHTEILSGKCKKINFLLNQNNKVTRMLVIWIPKHQAITRRALILRMCPSIRVGVQSVEIPPMWKAFSAWLRNSNVKLVTSSDISLVFVIKRSKHHSSLEDQRLTSYKQEQCLHKREPYVATLKITAPVMTHFDCKSRCSTHKPV